MVPPKSVSIDEPAACSNSNLTSSQNVANQSAQNIWRNTTIHGDPVFIWTDAQQSLMLGSYFYGYAAGMI